MDYRSVLNIFFFFKKSIGTKNQDLVKSKIFW